MTLLSILIPTRNRQRYIMPLIESILADSNQSFEIVIQDNSDTSILENFIDQINDSRVKYHFVESIISFSENFQKGIELCTGEYVCVIGDDDGINSRITEFAQFMKENQIEAVSFMPKVSYFWPGIDGLTRPNSGTFQIGEIKATTKRYKVSVEIVRLLKNAGQEYYKFGLPKIYHGIIKKTKIDECLEKFPRIFDSFSPDIYSCIKLSSCIDMVYIVDFPFSIAGACPESASAASMTKKHEGNFESTPHFRGFDDFHWSDLVPKFYSVETIWAQSLIMALSNDEQKHYIKYFDEKRLLQYCFSNHPKYRKLVLDFSYAKYTKQRRWLYSLVSYRIRSAKFFNRTMLRLKIILGLTYYKKYNNINDIFKASTILESHLSQRHDFLYEKLLNNFRNLDK